MLVSEVNFNAVQGPECVTNGWLVTATFTREEMEEILLQYDPSNPSLTPSDTTCRSIVVKILDAILASSDQTP